MWLAAAACSGSPTQTPAIELQSGALDLQLSIAGLEVTEITYSVTRAGTTYRSGRLLVSGADDNFSALLGGLESNQRYVISLFASALRAGSQEPITCTGSAPFAVSLGETTAITLALRCGGPIDGNPAGSQVCPSVDGVRALPAQALIGERVVLKAEVNVADTGPAPLMYVWSTSSGKLIDAVSASAQFECTEPGIATITIALSDADTACAEDRVPVYVTCRVEPSTRVDAAGAAGGGSGG
jgi:hypothetical protein